MPYSSGTLYIMEAANIYVGDTDPSKSNHLSVTSLKLPGLEEAYQDHTPGGAPVAIEVDTHITRLEANFNLAGWQPWVMTAIGSEDRKMGRFTALGLIRNRRSGDAIKSTAVMRGRLARVNPQESQRGQTQQHEYAIRGITGYRLIMGTDEIYDWDFWTSRRRVGGKDLNRTMNRMLNIG